MPALEIGGDLDFVDGDERGVDLARHGLDRAHPEARVGRLDFLLAGDEGDLVGPDTLDHPAIDLAGEEAQRQSDDAGGVREHALDGVVGLAGVGRPQNGRDTPGAELRRERAAIGGEERVHRRALRAGTARSWQAFFGPGTSLEQIRPESLTRPESWFVHHAV